MESIESASGFWLTWRWLLAGSMALAMHMGDKIRERSYRLVIEVSLLFLFLWYIRQTLSVTRSASHGRKYDAEISQKLAAWHPEPLVKPTTLEEKELLDEILVVKKAEPTGRTLRLADGRECLDLSSFNCLGLVNRDFINKSAIKALQKYGVGTSGPRGFYGTFDVHCNLEKRIAEIFKHEAAIIYSQAFSALSSTLYAFFRKKDYIIADDNINFALQRGLKRPGGYVKYFRHNDINHLKELINETEREVQKTRRSVRKMILVEALCLNSGEICNLKEIIELKTKYGYLLLVDESHSVGVLGKTGLGILEHLSLPPESIDIRMGSFSASFASSGGFCTGKLILIDYLHLNGCSYTFSASSPTLLVTAASEAIEYMLKTPEILKTLRENVSLAHDLLDPLSKVTKITKARESPIIHIYPPGHSKNTEPTKTNQTILKAIVKDCLKEGIIFTTPRYLESQEINTKTASIRVVISAAHTKEDIERAMNLLCTKFKEHFSITSS